MNLYEVLERARALGLLGPGPLEPQIAHAEAFAAGGPEDTEASFDGIDLGSGGGVPGLALALHWPNSRWVLLDALEKRAAFLQWAIDELALDDRVSVALGRAEELARKPNLRGRFAVASARGFAPPMVTAECAAGFLQVEGVLVVSEPPDAGPEPDDRWSTAGLAELGLVHDRLVHRDPSIRRFRLASPCPDRYPRRVGIPAKRPLR